MTNGGNMTITNSTLSGNSASGVPPSPPCGGGVLNFGSLTIMESTLTGNTAKRGGGVYNFSSLTIMESTLTGNTADTGGGVYNYGGTLTLNRTLISGNGLSFGLEVDTKVTITADNFNVFGHSGETNTQALYGFTPGPSDITATINGTTPTALGSILDTTLAFNGGPTQTHALVSGSPAIDAVTDGSCPPPATDQRGFGRPVDGDSSGTAECDSGAYEFGAVPPPVCGDGVVEGTEECDDGNQMDGDGCSAVCLVEPASDPCGAPTGGCTVNRVTNQPCVGSEGSDVIKGTAGADVIVGGPGDDLIRGGGGDDVLCGEGGNDNLQGQAGHDQLLGGESDDVLSGAVGNDALVGGEGNDRLTGAGGNDTLRGESGNDTLLAGPGNDGLEGGEGADRFSGGGGIDACTTDGEDLSVIGCE